MKETNNVTGKKPVTMLRVILGVAAIVEAYIFIVGLIEIIRIKIKGRADEKLMEQVLETLGCTMNEEE